MVLSRRAGVLLGCTTVLGLAAFGWPFLLSAAGSGAPHGADAPYLFALVVPLLLAVLAVEVADGGLDAKAIAILGILAALGAVLRIAGEGLAGVEPLFALVILAGRAYGRVFGFCCGALCLLASAVVTAGIGPWLPFQVLAMAWVGFGAGCLPSMRGRREVVLLAAYGALAAFAYGMVMDLWFWPLQAGLSSTVSYLPGGGLSENLRRFVVFDASSALGFDLVQATTNFVLLLLLSSGVLLTLRRAGRRAAFGPARLTQLTAVERGRESPSAKAER